MTNHHETNPAPEDSTSYSQPLQKFQFLDCVLQTPLLEVWKAHDQNHALKWVKIISGLARRNILSTFDLKQAAHLRYIKHPRLLPVDWIEHDNGRLVIVNPFTEYSLKDRYQECLLEGKPGVPREELLIYLRAVAEALDYLERQEALHHLSLSPNSLVLSSGEPKLMDYGLVELAWLPAGQPLDQQSLRYAAPEAFENAYTKTSDQYSLALIYCEMLTGRLPHHGNMSYQWREARLHRQPDLSLVPQHDVPVLLRALSKESGKRFHSIGELVSALEAVTPRPANNHDKQLPISGPPKYKPTDSANQLHLAEPQEIERTVNRLVQLAAYNTVVREQGGMRYQCSEDNVLTHRCAAWLPPGMAQHKLEGFAHQWQATQVTTYDENKMIFEMELPQNFWRRLVRAERDILEIKVSLSSPRSQDSKLTEVQVEVSFKGPQNDEGVKAVTQLGPVLINSIRTYLLATTEHRGQDRFHFDYPLWVYPMYAGSLGEGMSCHGKDISTHGIGFLAPYRLPTKEVQLHVLTPELGTVVVPAAILRTVPLPDSQFEIGARFMFHPSAVLPPL